MLLTISGNKYVLRGRPDFTPCVTDRYQPIRLWSNVSSQCIYKKSQCIGNGQIMYQNGTEESDSSCRCDLTRGYDFINKPRNASFCIPSEEDCSCYKKKCPHDGVLSSGKKFVEDAMSELFSSARFC